MRRVRLLLCVFLLNALPAWAQLAPGAFTTLQTTNTSSTSLLVGCAVGTTTCTGGIKGGTADVSNIISGGSISIADQVPGVTTNKIYQTGGTLFWNGLSLATGGTVGPGTTNLIPVFTGASSIGNSIMTQSGGNTITVATILNATTLGGTLSTVSQPNITGVGTLTTGTWNATIIGLAYGGAGVSLSATGGTSQVLRQNSAGATVTVSRLAGSDLSDYSTALVDSITGTANQVIVAGTGGPAYTGATTLSLPQSIATSSNVQFAKAGIGAAPTRFLDVLGTTEQLRLAYDSTDYTSFTVLSTGDLTIAPVRSSAAAANINLNPFNIGSVTIASGVINGTTTAAGLALAANALVSGTGLYAASSTLADGKLVDLQVSGTAAAASQTTLNILTAGATTTNAITTYGAQISNTHTNGTSGTNVALYLNASGATTANYGLLVNAGRVGVGTTAPAAAVHVTATTEQFRLAYDSLDYATFTVGSTGNLTMTQVNGSGNPNFFFTGNLSVGAATVNAKIHVLATTEQLRLGYDASNYNSFTVGSAGTLTIAPTGTNPNILLTPSGTGYVSVVSYLGVGATNTPTNVQSGTGLVHIYGSGASLRIQDTGATSDWNIMARTGASTNLFRIYDNVAAADRLAIDAAGLVGINVSPATYRLSVSGRVQFAGLTGSAGAAQTAALCLNASNELISETVNTCLVSSGRFKERMQPLMGGLAEVLRLRPISYFYRPSFNEGFQGNVNFSGEQVGLLAEEVQGVDPRLVAVETDGPHQGEARSVRYDNAVAVVIQAIQEQQHQLDRLSDHRLVHSDWFK